MAGLQALFSAQMLQPVNQLSDDDAAPAAPETPMAKPAGKVTPKVKQPKPKPSPKTPSPTVPAPSPKSSSSRPSALRNSNKGKVEAKPEPKPAPKKEPKLKRPASKLDKTKKDPKVCKCYYKATGQWGIKYLGKQLMSVPRLQWLRKILIQQSAKSANQ